MAAEIVGSAYVRIRAITAGLAKEIQDGLNKSVGDVNTESGEDLGENLSRSVRRGLENSSDELGDGLTGALDDIDLDDTGELIGDRLSRAVAEAFDGDGVGAEISEELGEAISEGVADTAGAITDGLDRAVDDVDTDRGGRSLARRFSDSFTNAFRTDNSFVNKLTKNLGDKLSRIRAPLPVVFVALAAAFGSQIVGPIVQLLGTYLIGLTAQVGLLLSALGGVGVAFAGAFGPVLLLFPVLLAGFTRAGKAFNRLRKSATDFARTFVEEVGISVQSTMLPGLQAAIDRLDVIIPLWKDFGRGVGGTIGNFAQFATEILTSDRNMQTFRNILDHSEVIIGRLAFAMIQLLDAALPLFEALLPVGEQFAAAIAEAATNFNNWVRETSGTGELTARFQEMYDHAVLVWNVLEDVFVALWNIFTVGAREAEPGMQRFGDWARDFREWTESSPGQNRIRQVFEDALPVFHEVNGIVADIVRALFSPAIDGGSESLVGALQRFREEILPDLIEFGREFAEDLAPHVQDLADAFGEFFREFQEAEGLEKSIDGIAIALEVLATILRTPFLGDAVAQLAGFATAFGILNAISFGLLGRAVGGLVSFLAPLASSALSGGISALTGALQTLAGLSLGPFLIVVAAVVAAIASLVFGFTEADWIIEQIQGLREWFNNLNGALKPFAVVLAAVAFFLTGTFGALIAFGVIIRNWREIPGFIAGAARSIWEFVQRLPGTLANAGRALWQWIQDAVPAATRAAGGFVASVGSAILGFVTSIPGWFAGAGQSLWQWIQDAVPEALRALGEFALNILGWIVSLPGIIGPRLLELTATFWEWIQEAGPGIARRLGEVLGQIVAWAAGAGPILALRLATLAVNMATWVRQGSLRIMGLLAGLLAGIVRWAIGAVPGIVRAFRRFQEAAIGWAIETARNLPRELLEIGGAIIGWIRRTVPAMVRRFGELARAAIEWAVDAARDLPGNLLEFSRSLLEFVRELPGQVLDASGEVLGTMLEIGGNLIGGLVDGIREGGGDVIDGILGAAGDLVDAIKRFFGIRSPSTLMTEIGGDIIAGLVSGLTTAVTAVVSFATELPGKITRPLLGVATTMLTRGRELISGFLTGMRERISGVTEFVTGIPGRIRDAAGSFLSTLASRGRDLISGLLDAAKTKWEDVKMWVGERASAVLSAIGNLAETLKTKARELIDGFKNGAVEKWRAVREWLLDRADVVVRTIGDLTDDLVQTGKDIVQGLIDGIEDLAGTFVDTLEGLAQDGLDAVTGIFDTNSPSRAMRTIGGYVVDGFVIGVDRNKSAVDAAMAGIYDSVVDPFQKAFTETSKLQFQAPDVSLSPRNQIAIEDQLSVQPMAQTTDPALLTAINALDETIDALDLVQNANTFNQVMPDAQAIMDELEFLRLRS